MKQLKIKNIFKLFISFSCEFHFNLKENVIGTVENMALNIITIPKKISIIHKTIVASGNTNISNTFFNKAFVELINNIIL